MAMQLVSSHLTYNAVAAVSRRANVQHSFAPAGPRPVVRRQQRALAAALPVATDVPGSIAGSIAPANLEAMTAVRKALRALGWDDAWIDGVVAEIRKGKLETSIPQIEATVGFLSKEVGIPMKSIENMAAVAPQILGVPTEQVQAVVQYVRGRGLSGAVLVALLEEHPKLLTYVAGAGGKVLEKGLARASVDLQDRHGRQVAGVSYWRTGAAFQTAPVAPYRPSPL